MSPAEKKRDLVLRVMDLMDFTQAKAWNWFATKNPLLGGFSPNELIQMGKVAKVEEFIKDAEEGNYP